MKRLLVLPGATNTLGGTLVTLSLFLKGLEELKLKNLVTVLAPKKSFLESYLIQAGQQNYIHQIDADNEADFIRKALEWISQQPNSWPLLLDNCIASQIIPSLIRGTLLIRLSKREVYFFFHDLGLSYNYFGLLARKLFFTSLNPRGLCNSNFTADHVRKFINHYPRVLYQPVDIDKSINLPIARASSEIQSILAMGHHILLTPSRLNKPGIINDKNLRAIIPVLVELNQLGYRYHSVIVGEDTSGNGSHTADLLKLAEDLGVINQLTILPATLNLQAYYPYASAVLSLAPREPFGRTIVEAIAFGRPVIGSQTGGIGEILSKFANEWMVNPNNPKEVAKSIIKIQENQDTRKLISDGQTWVREHCSPKKYAQEILEIVAINP